MSKNIIVSQIGARHRYLIPSMLENKGMLYKLYTDSTLYSIAGQIASLLVKIGFKNSYLLKLTKRMPPICTDRLKSSDYLLFKQLCKKLLGNKYYIDTTYQTMGRLFIKWGVGEADCVYNMFFENIEFMRYAKSKGLKIVVDIYESPQAFDSLIDEVKSIPEYACYNSLIEKYQEESDVRSRYLNEMLLLADEYTIPSFFVLKSLINNKHFSQSKVNILPYPSSITKKINRYSPIKHRLIWVGNDPVRKGIIYCAKAATVLKNKYPDLDFRVIGLVDKSIMEDNNFKDLNFVGNLNREELIKEYESAEAYVFPTLYEGLAGTIIEASCCGCPVITTENSGIDVNEFPAIIIPPRDVSAIIKEVSKLFDNNKLRDELSRKVFDYSNKKFDKDKYAEALANIL